MASKVLKRAKKAAKHLPAYMQDVAFTKFHKKRPRRRKERDDADRWLARKLRNG